MATSNRVGHEKSEKFPSNASSSVPSLQLADVVIVSCDTRGFTLASALARRGWKTVVIELDGGNLNVELEWSDRLGPFLSWEAEASADQELREHYGALWLKSGPVAFGGPMADVGRDHLRQLYGVTDGVAGRGQWPEALMRSIVSPRLLRRDSFEASGSRENTLRHVLETPVKALVNADAVRANRRREATAAGVRILDADQIAAVRLSDQHIDRIDFRLKSQTVADQLAEPLTERTRSIVWMLSEAESKRAEYVSPEVKLDELLRPGRVEPLLAWWRTRLAVAVKKPAADAKMSETLQRLPEIPPHLVVLGSVERPWTHDNLMVMNLIEESPSMRVFDVWMRVPYWARADHVYRDEQRILAQSVLADRFVGCDLVWVTPSPLALTEPAIRMPHILYSESSRSTDARLRNMIFAGPETWPAIGFLGLRELEQTWVDMLEKMRREWDEAAKRKPGPLSRLKNWGSSKEVNP